MFHRKNSYKNRYMLTGPFAQKGYDWWWHSFTGKNAKTGEEKAFFIEYFLCNPALGGDKPVLGQERTNKLTGRRPSYMMVKAGCWGEDGVQLHRFFAWDDVLVKTGNHYALSADDCFASDEEIAGSVNVTDAAVYLHPEYMCDAGSMSWDLKVDKQIAFNVGYGTSPLFCALKAFEMYWHAEGMKTAYSGTVTFNGEVYNVDPETSYGYADKNWGRNFTSPWVWLSSNDMTSRITGQKLENSVFDIGGGCPKIYIASLPKKLLGAFYYEGTDYEFNFSKFWMKPWTRFKCYETETEIVWKIIQENRYTVMKTEVHCKKKDMILVNYESPDGKKRHTKLWNGGTGTGRIRLYSKLKGKAKGMYVLVDDIDVGHIGCEYGEYGM